MKARQLDDLSDGELRQIEEVYADGQTIRETSRRLKMPERLVSGHLRRRGLTRGPRDFCGQNRQHPWNIQSHVGYQEHLAKREQA